MHVTGFNHVTIRVSNLSASLSFYKDFLGMREVHRGWLDAYLEWGNAWVCLIERECAAPAQTSYGVDHVAFSIGLEHFQMAADQLISSGVPIVRGPICRGGGMSIIFSDPDGTELELFTGSLAERMKVWT